mgnify:CR=1 FL=1
MRQTTFIATSDKSPISFSPYFCIVNKPIEYMETKKTTREEYQKCVNAVVDYINLHLGEEIDLKSLAKISHFSPFYFHRIMKAFLGEPIGTFIVRTRTETAARLLRYTDLPIADIAYRIGYSSSSSLSKVFKQFYGISPLEYRNNKNFVIMKPAIIRPELKLKREIKELPVRNVIYIRLFGDYKLNDYCGTWMRLQQFVQEEKLPMGEVMPYCIFHDDPKVTPIEKLRTDVWLCLPPQLRKAISASSNFRQDAMPYSCIRVRTNTCKVCTTQSMENTFLKWNVHSGMKPVPNDT